MAKKATKKTAPKAPPAPSMEQQAIAELNDRLNKIESFVPNALRQYGVAMQNFEARLAQIQNVNLAAIALQQAVEVTKTMEPEGLTKEEVLDMAGDFLKFITPPPIAQASTQSQATPPQG